MRLTCDCYAAGPHDLAADVKVFDRTATSKPFVTLKLTVGDDVIHVFLPAHAYQRARDLADLWPQLADPAPAVMSRSYADHHQ